MCAHSTTTVKLDRKRRWEWCSNCGAVRNANPEWGNLIRVDTDWQLPGQCKGMNKPLDLILRAVEFLACTIGANHKAILRKMAKQERQIQMNQADLEALLNNQTTQIGKISKEQADRFDALTAKIKELQDLIDAGGTITPAVEAAATAVQAALDSLDAAIPDAPTPA